MVFGSSSLCKKTYTPEYPVRHSADSVTEATSSLHQSSVCLLADWFNQRGAPAALPAGGLIGAQSCTGAAFLPSRQINEKQCAPNTIHAHRLQRPHQGIYHLAKKHWAKGEDPSNPPCPGARANISKARQMHECEPAPLTDTTQTK